MDYSLSLKLVEDSDILLWNTPKNVIIVLEMPSPFKPDVSHNLTMTKQAFHGTDRKRSFGYIKLCWKSVLLQGSER